MKYIFSFSLFVLLLSCDADKSDVRYSYISGEAQGTTYNIKYDSKVNYKLQVDSILNKVDLSMSTYIPNSKVSRFNKSDSGAFVDQMFIRVLQASYFIYGQSSGLFDPSIKPLVSYWGFGGDIIEKVNSVDSFKVDSLVQLINLDGLKPIVRNQKLESIRSLLTQSTMFDSLYISKNKNQQLDFNAIAQGYSVDIISMFLESKGIINYLVELGGEMSVKGMNENGELWTVGIDKPIKSNTETRELQVILELQNKSIATSGNYRKFYELNGKKYSHMINPKSGFPAENNLLSATIIAENCMIADGFATAFMLMGLEESKKFIEANEGIDAYFISSEETEFEVWKSSGLESMIKKN